MNYYKKNELCVMSPSILAVAGVISNICTTNGDRFCGTFLTYQLQHQQFVRKECLWAWGLYGWSEVDSAAALMEASGGFYIFYKHLTCW